MNFFLYTLIAGFLLFFNADAVKLKVACRSKGNELELCKEAITRWIKENSNKQNGSIEVEIVILPHASNECFGLYQQWFSAKSFDVDVMPMDVAWVDVFGDYLADLKECESSKAISLGDYFDVIKKNMIKDGRLIALPWYSDIGVMYYRTDLLKKYHLQVPKTWQELYKTALLIQNEERKNPERKGQFYGLMFQAKAFECLTCYAVEMFDSFGGAVITDKKVTVNSQRCIDAVQFMIDCVKNITSGSVLNYNEEDCRGVFQSGNAAFMRNWPYAWSLMDHSNTIVAKNIGIMPIPPSENGGKHSGILGGWFLTVSKYSKNKELAASLIKFLTSREQQKLRSEYSYLPTFKSLYSDQFVLGKNPFFAKLYHALENAVARPSTDFGKGYPRASTEIFNTINIILTESIEQKDAVVNLKRSMDRLEKKLTQILSKGVHAKIETKGLFDVIKEAIAKIVGLHK